MHCVYLKVKKALYTHAFTVFLTNHIVEVEVSWSYSGNYMISQNSM